MNIRGFEKHVGRKLLDRGYDYYNCGRIADVIQNGDDYTFIVEGSDVYKVNIKLDSEGEILHSQCNCPYDLGPICKHQVAAYFELSCIVDSEEDEDDDDLEDNERLLALVLQRLPKETLVSIIMEYVADNPRVIESLLIRYNRLEPVNAIDSCRNLVESIVESYRGRDDFISYRNVYHFAYEISQVLDRARETDDPKLGIDISFLILNEAMEAFQYSDDSGGDIGNLVSESIEVVGEIVDKIKGLDISIKEQIFNKIILQCTSNIFNGWEDFRIDLLTVCTSFADEWSLRNKLIICVRDLINRNNQINDEFDYLSYTNERLLKIKYSLIKEYEGEEEAEKFVKENLVFSSFREIYVSKCISRGNYSEALDLLLEAESRDVFYPGLVEKWKKLRYDVYKMLSCKEEQKALAKELLLEGQFEYYEDLKALHENKEDFYQNLKQELFNYKGWHGRSIYLKLVVKENDKEAILKYVKENPSSIETYVDYLLEPYKDEVEGIYKQYIMGTANISTNRNEYKNVCQLIMKYGKKFGKDKMREVISELTVSFKRRPAFMDELSKIK